VDATVSGVYISLAPRTVVSRPPHQQENEAAHRSPVDVSGYCHHSVCELYRVRVVPPVIAMGSKDIIMRTHTLLRTRHVRARARARACGFITYVRARRRFFFCLRSLRALGSGFHTSGHCRERLIVPCCGVLTDPDDCWRWGAITRSRTSFAVH